VLNQSCEAIGGHYVLTNERRLAIDGNDVLVFLGYGVVDTSCCGPGGCRYALVPGTVHRYRSVKTPEGRWISEVFPVRSPHLQQRIREHLQDMESIQQVQFGF
jgi:hypothetical protein